MQHNLGFFLEAMLASKKNKISQVFGAAAAVVVGK
jgi:hypothetical protein